MQNTRRRRGGRFSLYEQVNRAAGRRTVGHKIISTKQSTKFRRLKSTGGKRNVTSPVTEQAQAEHPDKFQARGNDNKSGVTKCSASIAGSRQATWYVHHRNAAVNDAVKCIKRWYHRSHHRQRIPQSTNVRINGSQKTNEKRIPVMAGARTYVTEFNDRKCRCSSNEW